MYWLLHQFLMEHMKEHTGNELCNTSDYHVQFSMYPTHSFFPIPLIHVLTITSISNGAHERTQWE